MDKQKFRIFKKFLFQLVSMDVVKKIMKDQKRNKSVGGEIPIKISKDYEFTFEILSRCARKSLLNGEFPDCLRQANASPIFKCL